MFRFGLTRLYIPHFIPTGYQSCLSTPHRHYAHRPGVSKPMLSDLSPEVSPVPSGLQAVVRWWRRLRPLKAEWDDLCRRVRGNRRAMDKKVPQLTRYFVRFPFLTDSEFLAWDVTTDSQLGQGCSWAEFVRSPCHSSGCAQPLVLNLSDDVLPFDSPDPLPLRDNNHAYSRTYPNTFPKVTPYPGSKEANSAAAISSITDTEFRGYGVFRGFISTRVPGRGDIVRAGFANLRSPESYFLGFVMPYPFFSYTHLTIRYRGDGRAYRINILPRQTNDVTWYFAHHFVLYTRGGPYWQVAKIPLSKFFLLDRGTVRLCQNPVDKSNVRLLSFTIMDNIDGPFSLELDYIALYCDTSHREQFAYEQYDRKGIVQ